MTRLDWNLDEREEETSALELAAAEPEAEVLANSGRWRPSAGALTLYLAALIAAGFFGFRLGRFSVAEGEVRLGIETSLVLEEIAWKNADLDLYLSTLDPNAAPGWLDREARQFSVAAPADYRAELVRHAPTETDRVLVVIEESVGGEPGEGPRGPAFTSDRVYRPIGGAWVRTPPDG